MTQRNLALREEGAVHPIHGKGGAEGEGLVAIRSLNNTKFLFQYFNNTKQVVGKVQFPAFLSCNRWAILSAFACWSSNQTRLLQLFFERSRGFRGKAHVRGTGDMQRQFGVYARSSTWSRTCGCQKQGKRTFGMRARCAIGLYACRRRRVAFT